MTYAGSYAYMSPQVAEHDEYTNKTDVWSVGWVFYNVMTLEFPNLNPRVSKRKLDATQVPIPNDGFKPLRDCICSRMIVPMEDERSSIDDVIVDSAFRDFYHLTEAKAMSWTYQEAIDEMSDRLLDAKQVQLQNQVDERIVGMARQVEKAVQLVTNFAEELERKQVQMEIGVAERRKLQEKVEELQQKLNLSEQQRQRQPQFKRQDECKPDFQSTSDDEVR